MSGARAVHHSHAAWTSRTGRLAGWTWRWTRASAAHAVDGTGNTDTAWSLCGCTCRCCDSDEIAFAWVETALDAIARRQKGVEALDKAWVSAKEGGNPFDDARGIYRLALELRRVARGKVMARGERDDGALGDEAKCAEELTSFMISRKRL